MFRDSRGEQIPNVPTMLLPSTTVILVEDQSVRPWRLLIHQRADNHWWGFPGGGQELGESILACAHRECREETGYTVQLDRLVCVDSDPHQGACVYYAMQERTLQYTNLTFLAHVLDGTLCCSEESLQVCWVPNDCLPSPFLPTHRWRLRHAMQPPTLLPVR